MEQRLIDANALKARIQAWEDRLSGFYGTNDDMVITLDKVQKQIIDDMPTVDAVPVVHAYWIIKPHGTYGQLRAFCSACGKHSGIGGIVSNQKKPYCPNCGAIMDGKEIVDG